MQRSIEAGRLAGMESTATLTITDPKGNNRVRQFSSAAKKYDHPKMTKMVMRFLSPADVKGIGILTFDYDEQQDEMWIYMPALRKTRRIVSREKSKNFMGSEFTNADLTTPTLADYAYDVLGEENIYGMMCWKIQALPVSAQIAEEYGYSKKIIWVAQSDYMARQIEFYDLDDVLQKVLIIEEVVLLDEASQKYQATKLRMENKLNGRRSKFEMEKILFNPDVKDDYFSNRFLENP